MTSPLPQEKKILQEYIHQELNKKSHLLEYIVNQNIPKLMKIGIPKSSEEYRIVVQEIFSQYHAYSVKSETKQPFKVPQQNKYITLNDQQIATITTERITQYQFLEKNQVIYSNKSAQSIYSDIVKYLLKHDNPSILEKKYLRILTLEEWQQKQTTTKDKAFKNKYQQLEYNGKVYMIFISIGPAGIMKRLLNLFRDLNIKLDNFKIYYQNNMNENIITKNQVFTISKIRDLGQPDLIYDPENLELFYSKEAEFKRELLKYKRAKKLIYKVDNSIDEQVWNASNLTPESDLKMNITTNHLIRGYLKYRTLERIEFFIIRETS